VLNADDHFHRYQFVCVYSAVGATLIEGVSAYDPNKEQVLISYVSFVSQILAELKSVFLYFSLNTQEYPLSYVEDGVPKGIVFDFVNILKDKYGFNYTVEMPKENIMGDADTGIVSMVYKKVRGAVPEVSPCLE
jgi:hypothetical protein